MLEQIILIFQKELRYALRDTDVLIYSLLVPLVVYPLFIIGAGEVLLWQTNSEKQQFRFCVQDSIEMPEHLYNRLKTSKEINLVSSSEPMKDLNAGLVDVVVKPNGKGQNASFSAFVARKRGFIAAEKVRAVLAVSQLDWRQSVLKQHAVPDNLLNVYSLSTVRLVPTSPHDLAVEKQSPLILVGAVIIGLMQAGLVAGVTAVCMFAEEKEKKTFETTISLPVSGYGLTVGKWLAATTLTIGSSCLYLIAVTASFFVVAAQVISMQHVSAQRVLPLLKLDPASAAIAVLTMMIGSGLGCALCMLCVSACKTFKDAQAISLYPMIVILSLPMVAMIPGIEQRPWVAALPLTNSLIALKHPQSGLLNLILCSAESLTIIAISLWFAGRIFFSEKSVFSLNGNLKSQGVQQQAESV